MGKAKPPIPAPAVRGHLQDLTGCVFGSLTVTGFAGRDTRTRWHCLCSCGARTVVEAPSLKNGHTTSCGCLHRKRFTRLSHGQARHKRSTRTYRVWTGIISRCYNPKHARYADYGGRGIFTYERWRGRGGFERFFADMGAAPSRKHSIDRIDNDGPYSPENCRWATREEQANNTRNNRLLTHDGITMTMTRWARKAGVKVGTLWARLSTGWGVAKALTTPVGS